LIKIKVTLLDMFELKEESEQEKEIAQNCFPFSTLNCMQNPFILFYASDTFWLLHDFPFLNLHTKECRGPGPRHIIYGRFNGYARISEHLLSLSNATLPVSALK
jgi:hypothetical protein